MEHLKSTCRLRILDKDVAVRINSLLLKKIIEQGFNYHSIKKAKKPLPAIPLMLKDTCDIREVMSSLLKFTVSILKDMQEKYWIFHGSAFSQDGQAAVMLGDSGAGKSSLCFAAGLFGANVISDEYVLVDKKNYLVTPFRYLIKLDAFYDIFSNWSFAAGFDFNSNRFIRKGKIEDLDFYLFTREDLNKLGIGMEYKKTPLKKILLLEDKRYDAVIHLYKHCLNKGRGRGRDFQKCIKGLRKLNQRQAAIFLPGVAKKLKYEKEIRSILNKVRYI